MTRKILIGSTVWLILITALHIRLNVGWDRMVSNVRVMFGGERSELVVGFLPVT